MCAWPETLTPCGTMVISDMWDRRHEDPLAVNQRWYCKICTAKYKTTLGVICEMVHPRPQIAAYVLAEHPPL